jgi:hypothetical protein
VFRRNVLPLSSGTLKIRLHTIITQIAIILILNTENLKSGIKNRLNLGNACYSFVQNVLSCHLLPKTKD